MSTITVLSSSDTTISITWSPLTSPADGNSQITSYNLQWDSGLGGTFTDVVSSMTTVYTATALTGGTVYKF